MHAIQHQPVPPDTLLQRLLAAGAYADCYAADIARPVSHAEFVEAFYTTAVFRLERFVLRWLCAKPSTDAQALQLATLASDTFAAWSVEARAPDQLLLCDFTGRTRSWLMTVPVRVDGTQGTRLFFGSAVVPRKGDSPGDSGRGFAFRALLGFHKLYSRVLLAAARARLNRHRAG